MPNTFATNGVPQPYAQVQSTFYCTSINQPIKHVLASIADDIRQHEIERLRSQYQGDFDRIEGMMPTFDDLASISVAPPREWSERWS